MLLYSLNCLDTPNVLHITLLQTYIEVQCPMFLILTYIKSGIRGTYSTVCTLLSISGKLQGAYACN